MKGGTAEKKKGKAYTDPKRENEAHNLLPTHLGWHYPLRQYTRTPYRVEVQYPLDSVTVHELTAKEKV